MTPSQQEGQQTDVLLVEGKVKKQNEVLTYNELRILNIVACLVFWYEGLVCAFFSTPYEIPITMTAVMPDKDGNNVPITQVIFKIQLQHMLALYFFLAGSHHCVESLPYIHDIYCRNIAKGVNPFRWAEYCFSASIVSVVMAVVVGVCDLGSLLFLAGCIFTCNAFGLLAELYDNDWVAHIFGWLVYMPFWFYLFAQFGFLTGVPQGIGLTLVILNLVLYTLFGVNQVLHLLKISIWKNFIYVEISYMILSILCKTLIGCSIFLTMLIKRPEGLTDSLTGLM
eukprot:GILK01001263.1.p1 GENE.GILK01001263.1~~GILK01001263.1.p1  ORF type:complete len:294 (+),score=43.52 GILK01001263.1:39-884(+)